jgi:hypothetical protein
MADRGELQQNIGPYSRLRLTCLTFTKFWFLFLSGMKQLKRKSVELIVEIFCEECQDLILKLKN